MERIPVTSTNIQAIGYDPATETLQVEFLRGAVYQYAGVPQAEHDGIMNADSKGKYFIANIKDRYPFEKI